MDKYQTLAQSLKDTSTGSMKCYGNSMLPILTNPCINTYVVADDYDVGDIVFCKVNGCWIDAHLITKKAADGRYLISNNHGHDNGWTRRVYGKVTSSKDMHGNVKNF